MTYLSEIISLSLSTIVPSLFQIVTLDLLFCRSPPDKPDYLVTERLCLLCHPEKTSARDGGTRRIIIMGVQCEMMSEMCRIKKIKKRKRGHMANAHHETAPPPSSTLVMSSLDRGPPCRSDALVRQATSAERRRK